MIIKNKIAFIVLSILLGFSACSSSDVVENSSDPLHGTINASGAFALYPIMVKWSEEFKKLHPNVKFNVSAGGAGKGISDAVGGLVDIGMVSRELNPSEFNRGAYTIAVTKDAVVPVVCAANPNLQEILQKGISAAIFKNMFIDQKYNSWKELGFSVDLPLHIYTRSDAAGAAESWAKYFGKKQEDLQGIGVFGDPGLLQSVKKDSRSIGYNNIGFAYNIKTRKPNKGIVVVPIDINGNGVIDADENFYKNLDQISAAIASGKFPSPPARDLYFVTKGKPQDKAVVEFIRWVLTEGQQYVIASGYVGFDKEKLENELKKIN